MFESLKMNSLGCLPAYRDAYRDAWMLTGLTGMPRDAEPQEPAAAAAAALSRQFPRRPYTREQACEAFVLNPE